jgi:GWxTD domain-containing protein
MAAPKLFIKIACLLSLLLLLLSCARDNYPREVDTGEKLVLTQEGPVFVANANGRYSDEGEVFLSTTIELFKSNLVFKTYEEEAGAEDDVTRFDSRMGSSMLAPEDEDKGDEPATLPEARANVRYEVFRLFDDKERERIIREDQPFIIEGEPGSVIQSYERLRYSRDFETEPGSYEVFFTVTDLATGKSVRRSTSAFIPDTEDENIAVSDISIFGAEEDEAASSSDRDYIIPTYGVNNTVDDLVFSFFVNRPLESEPVYVHSRLIKFESDNEPARLPTAPRRTQGSIERQGIDYDDYEVLTNQTRVLENEFGGIEIELQVPIPESGSYRFEMFVADDPEHNADRAIEFKARDFGIWPENFPNVGKARELAAPLAYLMNRKDYEQLMSVSDPDSLKRAVDIFWLENLGSARLAREVMALYYQRVVEANMQFTNFKEGWKTDMGMVYVVFGPPWYVDRRGQTIRWTYGYDTNDPRRTFDFYRDRMDSRRFPFDNWVLQRRQNYHHTNYERVQDWLTGHVLDRNYPY